MSEVLDSKYSVLLHSEFKFQRLFTNGPNFTFFSTIHKFAYQQHFSNQTTSSFSHELHSLKLHTRYISILQELFSIMKGILYANKFGSFSYITFLNGFSYLRMHFYPTPIYHYQKLLIILVWKAILSHWKKRNVEWKKKNSNYELSFRLF